MTHHTHKGKVASVASPPPETTLRKSLEAASVSGLLGVKVFLNASVLSVMTLVLPGFSIAQQTIDPATRMPQAPQAPTVEEITAQSAQNSRQAAQPATKIDSRLSLELQQADGQDTNNGLQRDTGQAELQLTLGIEQQWNAQTRLVGRLELSTRYFTEDELNASDEEFAYDLERFFVEFKPQSDLRLRAGRQRFDDPLEAIVDENLDGLAVSYDRGLFELELSHTREDWFEASTVTVSEAITNTMASVYIRPKKDTLWMPYILQRSTKGSASRTWIGLQGIVEPDNSPWRYWVHASTLDGEDTISGQNLENGETTPERAIDVGGEAIDLGINWSLGGALKPTFTLAIAQGSGGPRNERFRQSGLHDNDFALNGKNSFRYLGEVLDPELTNIRILTLGMGVELGKDWNADIALHTYDQVKADDQLRGSDVEYEPEGIVKDLGSAADLIIAYEHSKQLEIVGTVGAFMPGSAFDSTRDTAWIARAELEYRF